MSTSCVAPLRDMRIVIDEWPNAEALRLMPVAKAPFTANGFARAWPGHRGGIRDEARQRGRLRCGFVEMKLLNSATVVERNGDTWRLD